LFAGLRLKATEGAPVKAEQTSLRSYPQNTIGRLRERRYALRRPISGGPALVVHLREGWFLGEGAAACAEACTDHHDKQEPGRGANCLARKRHRGEDHLKALSSVQIGRR
jgi:hypothetical protein